MNTMNLKAQFEINGMTCTSCAYAVEQTIRQMTGVVICPQFQLGPLSIEDIQISLSTNTGTAVFTAKFGPLATQEDICEKLSDAIVDNIEAVGFGCSVLDIHTLLTSGSVATRATSNKDDSHYSFWQLTLGITGMTCSSCSETIESHLKRVLGAKAPVVEVNLATMTASIRHIYRQGVDCDEQKIAIFDMIKDEIEGVGFECEFLEATAIVDASTHAGIEFGNSDSVSITIPATSCVKSYLLTVESVSSASSVSNLNPTSDDLTRLEVFLKNYMTNSPNSGIIEVKNCLNQKPGDDISTGDHALSLRVTINDEVIGLRKIRNLAKDELQLALSMSSLCGGIMMANRLNRQQKLETAKHLRDLIVALCFTIPILMITMVLPSYVSARQILFGVHIFPGINLNGVLLLLLSSPVQWIVGYRFHRKALHSLWTKVFGMDFLISTGTTAAYMFSCIGFLRGMYSGNARNHDVEYFETSAVLITVVVIGKYLEVYAKGKTASAIHKLTNLRSKTARLICDVAVIASGNKFVSAMSSSRSVAQLSTLLDARDSNDSSISSTGPIIDEEINAILIERFDFIRLVTGESIPADGILTHGLIGVDESMMTGESAIISKHPGDHVYAGTTVIEGSGVCYVTASGDDSTLGKIVSTVQDAQAAKPPIQEVADRVAHYFVPIVAAISLLTFIVWITAWKLGFVPKSWYTTPTQLGLQEEENISIDGGGNPILFAFLFALSVWVSACPCSFGLATPTAILVSTGVAANNGILFRKGSALQHCAEVDTIAFDKTGTLTMGKSAISDFYLFRYPCNQDDSISSLRVQSGSTLDVWSEMQSAARINIASSQYWRDESTANIGNVGHSTVNNGFNSLQIDIVDAFIIFQFIIKAESKSNHPLARGIVDFCKAQIDHLLAATSSSTSFLLEKLESTIFSRNDNDMEISFDVIPGRGLKLVISANEKLGSISARNPNSGISGDIEKLIDSSSILKSQKDIDGSFSIVIGSETLMLSEGCISHSLLSENTQNSRIGDASEGLPKDVMDVANSLRSSGKVTIFLGIGDKVFAVMGISDTLRPESRHVISDLYEKGYLCYMITGDEERTAMAIGQAVGIPTDFILAGAKPHDKEAFIAALQAKGRKVLFIGDGTNDSPALARSNVGIAMAGGTDIAIEAGDIVFCRNSLELLPIAISIARKTLRRIKINYFWALIYNCFLIPLAAGVLYPSYHFSLAPMMAGSAMAMSSISIVVSSLMLGLYKPPRSMLEQQNDDEVNTDQSFLAALLKFFGSCFGSGVTSETSSPSISSKVLVEMEIRCQCPSSVSQKSLVRGRSWYDILFSPVSQLLVQITLWSDKSRTTTDYTALPPSSHSPLHHLGDSSDDVDDEEMYTIGSLNNRSDHKSLTVPDILFGISGTSTQLSSSLTSLNERHTVSLKKRTQVRLMQRNENLDRSISSGGCSCRKSNCRCGQDCLCGELL